MMKANQDIRQKMKEEKIALWQVAHFFKDGVHENTMRRKLRFELSENEKTLVYEAIEKAKAEFK